MLKSAPGSASSPITRRNENPEWTMEAINAPVGKLAEVLMNDPSIKNLNDGKSFPAFWINRVEELLTLEGDLQACIGHAYV